MATRETPYLFWDKFIQCLGDIIDRFLCLHDSEVLLQGMKKTLLILKDFDSLKAEAHGHLKADE